MPIVNTEMSEPSQDLIEDYFPIEIIEGNANEDGTLQYTVKGLYFGKEDFENWTADEFEKKPEYKTLLENWN